MGNSSDNMCCRSEINTHSYGFHAISHNFRYFMFSFSFFSLSLDDGQSVHIMLAHRHRIQNIGHPMGYNQQRCCPSDPPKVNFTVRHHNCGSHQRVSAIHSCNWLTLCPILPLLQMQNATKGPASILPNNGGDRAQGRRQNSAGLGRRSPSGYIAGLPPQG